MFLTQEDIAIEIAEKEKINIKTVRRVLKALESIIFEKLHTVSYKENILIKIFKGLSITRSYCPKREYNKGMFKEHQTSEKVKVRADISRHYNNSVNDKIFHSAKNR